MTRAGITLGLLCVLLAPALSAASRWDQRWFAGAPTAGVAASPRWRTDLTIEGDPAGVGSVCGSGTILAAAGPAYLAAPGMSTRLRVDRDPADPAAVRLHWTGSAKKWAVYRAETADGVESGTNRLGFRAVCAYDDAEGVSADVLYYLVVPMQSFLAESVP